MSVSEENKTNSKPKTGGTKKKKASKKNDRSTKILIVGCVLIAIPFLILGWILISASMNTGKPINGDRFMNDLDPAIKKEQISEVESKIKSEASVESVKVELVTATLRVYVDAENSITEEAATALAKKAYDDVASVLTMNTYFTSSNGKKMYDLEIHVYNSLDKAGSDSYVYVIESKSSTMAESKIQTVSKPLDAELAQQLRDELEEKRNPTTTKDPNSGVDEVGGSEEEKVTE